MVAAIGSVSVPWTALRLRALQGREAEAAAAIASAIEQAAAGAHTLAIYAHWAAAVLYNGLARYEEAAASARQATSNTFEYWVSVWALPELVEAAARVQDTASARDALERLAETTQPSANDFALGIEARCRALLSEGAIAERLYQDAIERLGRDAATTGARARSPAVRGVAASRAPPPGRPRTAADSAPDVHRHWHGGVRRTRSESSCGRPGRRCASGASRRATSSPRRSGRSLSWPATASPTPRSGRDCSSARAPWSGTWARCSRSSGSAPAGSFPARCQAPSPSWSLAEETR